MWDYARSRCTESAHALSCLNQSHLLLRSAFRDGRYSKLQRAELQQLAIQVSLLSCYEKCARWDEWEVGKHGITIGFDIQSKHYSGTYLPQIASEEGKPLIGRAPAQMLCGN